MEYEVNVLQKQKFEGSTLCRSWRYRLDIVLTYDINGEIRQIHTYLCLLGESQPFSSLCYYNTVSPTTTLMNRNELLSLEPF